MHILLLGGSNAGVRDGWAAQLAGLRAEDVVENRFLGAVGSLYGLMALMKREREGAPLPDRVILEYCLNDILLAEARVLPRALVTDTLAAIVDFCARKRLPLIFLCLEPRPDAGGARRPAIRRIERLYAAAARRAGLPCLRLRDILGETLTPAHYQDENHLTTATALRVADGLQAAIGANIAPPAPARGRARFTYVDARQAIAAGPCALCEKSSRVFEGPFLEMARGSSSLWPGDGRLAGLLLQSGDMSGAYRIRAGARDFRKNPRSQMQEIVRNLVLLHYSTRRPLVSGSLEIDMPEDEAALMRLPEDTGLLAAPAAAPFTEQTLDIHGVMLWRKRGPIERLLDFFGR